MNPLGPAQAPTRALDQQAQPQTVTSHSLTFSSKAFCLDFTWSRVEPDQPPRRAAVAGPAAEAAAATQPPVVQYDRRARTVAAPAREPAPVRAETQARPSAGRQSFAEVLRRQQLAGLLLLPSRPPADRQTLFTPTANAAPQAGPVCRAYAEALGPLGAEASRFYTV